MLPSTSPSPVRALATKWTPLPVAARPSRPAVVGGFVTPLVDVMPTSRIDAVAPGVWVIRVGFESVWYAAGSAAIAPVGNVIDAALNTPITLASSALTFALMPASDVGAGLIPFSSAVYTFARKLLLPVWAAAVTTIGSVFSARPSKSRLSPGTVTAKTLAGSEPGDGSGAGAMPGTCALSDASNC